MKVLRDIEKAFAKLGASEDTINALYEHQPSLNLVYDKYRRFVYENNTDYFRPMTMGFTKKVDNVFIAEIRTSSPKTGDRRLALIKIEQTL
jgi:hypothetical protein